MMSNPYRVTSTRSIYSNSWISVREDQVVKPDGSNGLFGIVEMKSGSTVLALDAELNALLVREYKYAIDRTSLELVSGGIDGAETPLDAAKRELLEETGATSDFWTSLGKLDPFSSVINSPNYMFLARGVVFPKVHVARPDEPIQLFITPFSTALQMVMDAEITHGASCVTILKAAQILMRGKVA